MKIKLISINCHGLRNPAKRQNVFQWLRNLKPDVIFLQETYLQREQKNFLPKKWDGTVLISSGGPHSTGTASLFEKRLYLIVKLY